MTYDPRNPQPSTVIHWCSRAKPGDTMTYFVGELSREMECLDKDRADVLTALQANVSRLERAELLNLVQHRVSTNCFEYIAQRR